MVQNEEKQASGRMAIQRFSAWGRALCFAAERDNPFRHWSTVLVSGKHREVRTLSTRQSTGCSKVGQGYVIKAKDVAETAAHSGQEVGQVRSRARGWRRIQARVSLDGATQQAQNGGRERDGGRDTVFAALTSVAVMGAIFAWSSIGATEFQERAGVGPARRQAW